MEQQQHNHQHHAQHQLHLQQVSNGYDAQHTYGMERQQPGGEANPQHHQPPQQGEESTSATTANGAGTPFHHPASLGLEEEDRIRYFGSGGAGASGGLLAGAGAQGGLLAAAGRPGAAAALGEIGVIGHPHQNGHNLLYHSLDIDYDTESQNSDCKRPLQRLQGSFDDFGAISGPYSPQDPSYMPMSYQQLDSQGRGRGCGLAWGPGGPCQKWTQQDRDEIEGGRKSKSSTKSPSLFIPDHTLQQLTVKELNKKNLGRDEVMALKLRRRTLKNRGYAVQCRLRRQQHKDRLEMQVNEFSERLESVEKERDFYKSYYEKCCGRTPLNLEMINNNHELEYKPRGDMKIPSVPDEFRRYDGSHMYRHDGKLLVNTQDPGMFRQDFRDFVDTKGLPPPPPVSDCHKSM